MTENEAREEICSVSASLHARGYVHATAGNISVRLRDGFLITPTDASLGTLRPDEIAKVDLTGEPVSGGRPSKTLALHRRIYGATTAGCVIHMHSTHCVALTLTQETEELVPPITPYFVMKVGHVPVIPYHRPGNPHVAEQVGAAIEHFAARGTPIRAVMLSRLGPNVWHDSPAEAMAVLEELEETAKLWHLSQGRADPLTDGQIEELRRAFGAKW